MSSHVGPSTGGLGVPASGVSSNPRRPDMSRKRRDVDIAGRIPPPTNNDVAASELTCPEKAAISHNGERVWAGCARRGARTTGRDTGAILTASVEGGTLPQRPVPATQTRRQGDKN
jgi:hypothetical protein